MFAPVERGQQNAAGFQQIVDLIQSRYGWSDEYIMNLPYARFCEIMSTIGEALTAEGKNQLVNSAFIGWQMHLQQTPSNQAKSWKWWLRNFGLYDEKPVDNSEVEAAHQFESQLAGLKFG